MGKLVSRLRQTLGETLVETLAAMLLCTLAATALMTAIASASNLNMAARDSSDHYREVRQQAELQSGDSESHSITVDGIEYQIAIYGGSDVVSYGLADGA